MLDINLFREDKGGDPELIRESQRRRFEDVHLVDKVIALDCKWRQLGFAAEQHSKDLNALSKQVAVLMKKAKADPSAAGEASELAERSRGIKRLIAEAKQQADVVLQQRDQAMLAIGNLVFDTVPISNDEADNVVLREAGVKRPTEPWMLSHPDMLSKLGFANLEAGQAVSGARGYYLMGAGVLLNQALINYALQFLASRGFEPVYTPFFLSREVMEECAQLSQFDQELYRVSLDASKSGAGLGPEAAAEPRADNSQEASDKFLIATSEQPLCALHRQGWFEPSQLPLKYAGLSTCFRREVGSHGKDTLGIFRVHQFEKVEQFCITAPDAEVSGRMMDEMIGHAEDFYKSLDLPYRIVSLVSGALNKSASIKYDLEAWFPASRAYRELVSCSNCTDYQARRLDVRMRVPKSSPTPATTPDQRPQAPNAHASSSHVHMLNSTLTASQRTLTCLLENHQTQTGLRIPEPLRPFMMGIDFIPFAQAAAAAARTGLSRLRAR